MFTHQTRHLHLPMMISTMRREGLGQIEYAYSDDFVSYPRDDWWQRYVYDSTQRGLDILGARYGQGDYASPDDPRFRQQRQPLPYVTTMNTPAPASQPRDDGFKISSQMAMLVVGGILLWSLGKSKR